MIDLEKPLGTRGKYPVSDVHRLSTPVGKAVFFGRYKDINCVWGIGYWHEDGKISGISESGYALVNLPEEMEIFVNVCKYDPAGRAVAGFTTAESAEFDANHNPSAKYLVVAYPVKVPIGHGVKNE